MMDRFKKMNVLISFEKFQSGLTIPKSFQSSVITNRVFDIDFEKCREIDSYQRSVVTSLDIDRRENRFLLSGDDDGDIVIIDLNQTNMKYGYNRNSKTILGAHEAKEDKIAQWHPFEDVYITTELNHSLEIWDAIMGLTYTNRATFNNQIYGHHTSYATSGNIQIAVAVESPNLVLLDPKSASITLQFPAHRTGAASVRWLPKSEYLLASGGVDGKIRIWDIRYPGDCLKNLDYQNREAVRNEKDFMTAHDGKVNCLRFTDDGRFLVSLGADNHIRLWDISSYENTFVNYGAFQSEDACYQVSIDMCYDSNPPILFVPCLDCIFMYNLFTGRKIRTLTGHLDSVSSCVYRFSTNELYSTGKDTTLLTWTPDFGKEPVNQFIQSTSR